MNIEPETFMTMNITRIDTESPTVKIILPTIPKLFQIETVVLVEKFCQ